ncbi:MAG: toll/interleukin-1 receptor domain-containing protein [Oscillibacter sp.]|nr:toll/interleukin-1 receptor domain-containing protein [Oscillibacter sp.]MBQ9618735.1 toll/interleukin-1 receptor domain-containing protein [Oscillibacter sp.]
MADVFISYHEASAGEIARQVADALAHSGISCWYANRDLSPDFVTAIVQEIENCKVFLLILNEQSAHSQHVATEMALAFRRVMNYESVAIVPFHVDNGQLSDDMRYYLNRFQIVDGCPPDEERIKALTKQVAKILNRKRPLQHQAAAQPPL